MMTENFNVWEGVYNSLDKIEPIGDGFESSRWINQSLDKIKMLLDSNNDMIIDSSPLYSIASFIYSKNKKIKILDFGGGMGNSFVPLCSILPESDNIDFTVVEGKQNVKFANDIFANDSRIKFLEALPDDSGYDIVNIHSSLQYIDKWESLLDVLCKYKAKYFIFTDLPAGNIKQTYWSVQNAYESKIPHIFFKLYDVISAINKNDYNLIYQANFQATILGKYKYYPQDNFDYEYRINHSKNLIFKR